MMKILKATVAATALAGAAMLCTTPARADGFAFGIGSGGVSFSMDSGGYCDRWGCPDDYWDYPINDCPVFYGGEWYRGPVYYRNYRGRNWYWLHGNWREDQWDGPRPAWACRDHFRPALGFEFYENHGFRIRDDWRRRWHSEHDRGGDHGGGWQGNDHGGHDRDGHDHGGGPNNIFNLLGGGHGGGQGGGGGGQGGGGQGGGGQGGGHGGSGQGGGGQGGGGQGSGHGGSGQGGGGQGSGHGGGGQGGGGQGSGHDHGGNGGTGGTGGTGGDKGDHHHHDQ